MNHMLNNLVELLGIQPHFSVHRMSDTRAAEIIAHLDEGWSWRAEGSSEFTQWLEGRHLETGVSITIFLDSDIANRPVDHLSRARAIIAAAKAGA